MHNSTLDFLGAVHDPFKFDRAAKVPDLEQTRSVCMKDFEDIIEITNTSAVTVEGLMLFWSWGLNSLVQVSDALAVSDVAEAIWYRLWAIPIYTSAGGNPILSVGTGAVWEVYTGINQQTIIGQSGLVSPWGYDGLATSLRIFAGGLKVLPLIETVTSDSVTYVANIWGGQLTPGNLSNIVSTLVPTARGHSRHYPHSVESDSKWDDLASVHGMGNIRPLAPLSRTSGVHKEKERRVFSTKGMNFNSCRRRRHQIVGATGQTKDGYSPYELARLATDVQEYPNAQGCTTRYNPFQHEEQLQYFNVTGMRSTAATVGLSGFEIMNTDDIQMPFICLRFSQGGVAAGAAYPIKVFANWWLETELVLPTPIYTVISPVDPNFAMVRALASDHTTFPLTTSGHSFKPFLRYLGKFLAKAIKGGDLVDLAERAAIDGARSGVKAVAKSARRKRKKGKKKGKAQRARYRVKPRGTVLNGASVNTAVNRNNVPNS
jgi:hypothetical protein